MLTVICRQKYIATIDYSHDDKCFYGKLALIDDLVTFEPTNPKLINKVSNSSKVNVFEIGFLKNLSNNFCFLLMVK
jgi:hypothetical protein